LVFIIVPCTLKVEICLAQSQFKWAIVTTINNSAYSIIQTTDGGYAAAGAILMGHWPEWSYDFYIVKLNSSGMLEWTRTIGGTGEDAAHSIIQTTDGGYAVAGYTSSFGAGGNDFYIVKLDGSGTLLWSKTVGGTNDEPYFYRVSIIQTTDGGYVVASSTKSFGAGENDFYIVKLDGSGTLLWSKTVGGTSEDGAHSIIKTTDGGYAVAGYTGSFGTAGDMYIVKLDGSGTLQWSKTIGGTMSDEGYSIIQTTDGGYVVAGCYQPDFNEYNMYMAKLNSSGTLQWTRTVGIYWSLARSIIQTTDGGYAVAGYGNTTGTFIVKLNPSGVLQWSKTVGHDASHSIIQTTDGGYVVAGMYESTSMYIVKFDNLGNTCGYSTTPSSLSGTGGITTSTTPTVTSPASIVTTPTPTVSTEGSVTTICVIGIQPISNEIPSRFYLHQNYPNPFNPITKIRFDIPTVGNGRDRSLQIKIYDILGREITTLVNEQLKPGTFEVEWDGSNYPSGVYFYKMITDEFTETKKMVLIK
jgi:hypothetical protein